MSSKVPQFSNSEVDRAGAALASNCASALDFEIINTWRSAHNFPLKAFQAGLRKRARAVDSGFIVAQRTKRLSSIADKLRRSTTRLSQMQDIAGCRAVMRSVALVNDLVAAYKAGALKHGLHSEKNYIISPKPDGYRGVHLVYKYAGRRTECHGLNIEIQFRSASQHAWATAVETVDLFTRQALKSNKGHRDWQRFFALMGTAIAFREDGNPVPRTPTFDEGLRDTLVYYCDRLDVFNRLQTFGKALHELPNYQLRSDHYFLLLLDPLTKELEVRGYSSKELDKADRDYSSMERIIRGTDKNAVLVSVDSTADLRKAYPNYFLDTSTFLDLVEWAIK